MRLFALIASCLLLGAWHGVNAAETVTASDSNALSLTIYNQNFGVVRDVRSIDLKGGLNLLRIEDVAAKIDPTSVSIQSLTAPNSLIVREQNYQYDLVDPLTILGKSIGKTVTLRQTLAGGQVKEVTGVLLNSPRALVSDVNGNVMERHQGLVIRTPGGIILNPEGEIELKELPSGLVSRPSLLWSLETNKPGQHKAEVSYQTSGMSWRCDYVAVLNKDDTAIDLTSWVTLDNQSGASYRNSDVKLMAGDVHKVTEQQGTPPMMADGMAREASMAPQFQEKAFAEYHLYTLQRKTDILDRETKQLSLFNADNIPAKKTFVYESERPYYYGYGGQQNANKVNVKIEFQNTQQNHLGVPMPKGKVRVYKKDEDSSLQFIGEDLIDHTPRDEKLRIYIGDAFDVVGERRQLSMEQVSDRVQRASWEITLRNHKDSDIVVNVVEHAHGDWTITRSSQQYTKKDSTTFEFAVKVPANGETKVSYDIQTRW